jgi:N-acetylglucosamine-6-phosphate deacetylase
LKALPIRDCIIDVLRIDCGGGLVMAGFIDLQIAGGGGYLFSSNPNPEALQK